MKNKLFFGIILLLIGLYQIFGKFVNLNFFSLLFHYQIILILVGVYLLFKNKGQSMAGIFLIAFACYQYLKDVINPAYLDTIVPIIISIVGGVIIYLALQDRKK